MSSRTRWPTTLPAKKQPKRSLQNLRRRDHGYGMYVAGRSKVVLPARRMPITAVALSYGVSATGKSGTAVGLGRGGGLLASGQLLHPLGHIQAPA